MFGLQQQLSVQLLLLSRLCAAKSQEEDGTISHFWSQNRGFPGFPAYPGPTGFPYPAWTWPNENDELIRHGPLIDRWRNLYLVASQGVVRKFNENGTLLWTWEAEQSEGKVLVPGVLADDKMYLITRGSPPPGSLIVLGLEDGNVLVRRQLPKAVGAPCQDHASIAIENGVVFLASVHTAGSILNDKVMALNASDAALLWQLPLGVDSPGAVLINFLPSLPGDGTLLFATASARAYRLNATTGEVIWKASFREPGMGLVSTGGGTLSPDGKRFFAVGNYHCVPSSVQNNATCTPFGSVPPCTAPGLGCTFGYGIIVAYDVDTGEELWARRLRPGMGGNTVPAVGRLGGPGSPLAVVVGMGQNTREPQPLAGEAFYPWVVRYALDHLERSILGATHENHIEAMDAETGAELWHWQDAPWPGRAALGEEDERLEARMAAFMEDPMKYDVTCLPPSWAQPRITADGTVYAASGQRGALHAIRNVKEDWRISPDEVTTFMAQSGFRSGPSMAPGLLAAAPCRGPMHVFKT